MRKRILFVTHDGYSCVTWRQPWLEPKTHRSAPSMRGHRPDLLGRANFRAMGPLKFLTAPEAADRIGHLDFRSSHEIQKWWATQAGREQLCHGELRASTGDMLDSECVSFSPHCHEYVSRTIDYETAIHWPAVTLETVGQ